jgi:type I restriction enzyme S subunit
LTPVQSYSNLGIRFIRTTDIGESGELIKSGVYVKPDLVKDYMLKNGDILLSRSGTIGRCFLFDINKHGQCAYAGYLVRFIPNEQVLPKYIFRFTQTTAFDGFLKVKAISSTIENVNGEKYANCVLPFSPLPEQTAIVAYLDTQTAKLDAAITAARREIELLREYRERLIADVVTGKVDVREAAAQLPEEPPEEEDVEWTEDEATTPEADDDGSSEESDAEA